MLPFLALLSALGEGTNAYNQSVATRQQGRFAQQIAERNAVMSDKAATDAVQRGYTESNYAQSRTDSLVGSQRAALASQGLDPNSGTGLALQGDAQLSGSVDVATIRANAYREAYGFKTQALNIRTQGRLDRLSSRYKAKQMLLEGALKVLSGVSGQFSSPGSTPLTAPASSSYQAAGYAAGHGAMAPIDYNTANGIY